VSTSGARMRTLGALNAVLPVGSYFIGKSFSAATLSGDALILFSLTILSVALNVFLATYFLEEITNLSLRGLFERTDLSGGKRNYKTRAKQ